MTSVPAVSVDGADRSQKGCGNPSLRIAFNDIESPLNPSGKKVYNRNFLLQQQNKPASMKKPEGLPRLEVVRDKVSCREYDQLSMDAHLSFISEK